MEHGLSGRAANALRGHGQAVDDGLLQYLSPLGWEHINLTGDYLWRSSAKIGAQVQAATAAATGLACFIFRFLRRPLDRPAVAATSLRSRLVGQVCGEVKLKPVLSCR
jgi:hypothetical protein